MCEALTADLCYEILVAGPERVRQKAKPTLEFERRIIGEVAQEPSSCFGEARWWLVEL